MKCRRFKLSPCNEAYSRQLTFAAGTLHKVLIKARPPPSGPAPLPPPPRRGRLVCGIDPSKRTTPPERNMIARRRRVLELGPQIPSASLIMLSFRSGSVDVHHSAATRRILRPLEECPARRSQESIVSNTSGRRSPRAWPSATGSRKVWRPPVAKRRAARRSDLPPSPGRDIHRGRRMLKRDE